MPIVAKRKMEGYSNDRQNIHKIEIMLQERNYDSITHEKSKSIKNV